MKILIADKFEKQGIDGLTALGAMIRTELAPPPEKLIEALAQHQPAVLVVRSTKVPASVIDKAPSTLVGIVRAGAGVDNIDVPAATTKRIAVCNCPGTNSVAVAELTMGHLIACDRRLPDQREQLRAGAWNKKEYSKARGLKGSTLLIVGAGAIGREVAKRALAFDMRVKLWSRSLTPEQARSMGVDFAGTTRQDLLAALPACDHVSLHVAATAETNGMCDAAFFAAMKPGATFINTTRGSVCDEAAMLAAANAKGLRLGLDVYDKEPATPEASFRPAIVDVPHASLSHHCGASTDQAQLAVAEETVRIVAHWKQTGTFINRVN